jgi:hypothetical protein
MTTSTPAFNGRACVLVCTAQTASNQRDPAKWKEFEMPARITAKRVYCRGDTYDRESGNLLRRTVYPNSLAWYEIDGERVVFSRYKGERS